MGIFLGAMRYSIEVLTRQVDDFCQQYCAYATKLRQQDLRVFVPHVQGTPYQEIVESARILSQRGFRVVPHIAARNLLHTDDVKQAFVTFEDIGVEALLVLGGDSSQPQRFASVIELLASAVFTFSQPKELLFGVFPDGHPHVVQDKDALAVVHKKYQWAKEHGHTVSLVSQICFDSNKLHRYMALIRESDIQAPFLIGFVGPTSPAKMLKVANIIGLPKAAKIASKHNMFKLITGFRVDECIVPIVQSGKCEGLHIYPFGSYTKAMEKLVTLLELAPSHKVVTPSGS